MRLSTNMLAISAVTLSLTLTLLMPSGVALAQAGNAGQTNPGYSGHSAVNSGTIDDVTVKQTAKAYVKVRQIVQNAEQALNNSGNDAQKQQIAEQAESKKMAAVKGEGLQPQQYNQVIRLARADKSFEQKFLSYVSEVRNSPSKAN
jgi:hypothetical protein